MTLAAVPDLVPGDLSSQIDKLAGLVDGALSGDVVENADGLAKLVTSLAKLLDARTKAEQTVSKSDLQSFVLAMAESINAHVTSPEAKALIQRDWRRAISEVAG